MNFDLFFDKPPPKGPQTHRERWLAFHREHPQVYTDLVELARRMKARGFKHYAINTLYHVLRFHGDIGTTGEPFKLNNNHAPFYARLIMLRESDLDSFFDVRVQKSQNNIARDGRAEEDRSWRDDPFWQSLAK